MTEEIRNFLINREAENFEDFLSLSIEIINYLFENISERKEARNASNYHLIKIKNDEVYRLRPINSNLFIENIRSLNENGRLFIELLDDLSHIRSEDILKVKKYDAFIGNNYVNKICYTVQQGIACGLDVFVPSNQARKLVGIYFENMIRSILNQLKISNASFQFSIEIPGSTYKYKCGIDSIFNTKGEVKSHQKELDSDDVITSIKTSSKDRMPKIMVDKILLEKFSKKTLTNIALFHNDIQRSGEDKTSITFVANLFVIYTNYLTKLDGVYYIDPPNHITKSPWNTLIFPFSQFILKDLWEF